jgi:hypothetical protein
MSAIFSDTYEQQNAAIVLEVLAVSSGLSCRAVLQMQSTKLVTACKIATRGNSQYHNLNMNYRIMQFSTSHSQFYLFLPSEIPATPVPISFPFMMWGSKFLYLAIHLLYFYWFLWITSTTKNRTVISVQSARLSTSECPCTTQHKRQTLLRCTTLNMIGWILVHIGARLSYRPDYGGSKHLRNIAKVLPDYISQHSRIQTSSWFLSFENNLWLNF